MKVLLGLLFVMSTAYATETRQRIVVIDTGLGWHQADAPFLCKDYPAIGEAGQKNGDPYDDNGHGTNVIGLISKKMNYSKFCITSIKCKFENLDKYIATIVLTESMPNLTILNLSIEGPHPEYTESGILKKLLNRGVKIVVAAGNDAINLNNHCSAYPACYSAFVKSPNFIVVGGRGAFLGNTGKIVTKRRKSVRQGFPQMTGTSQATANMTGELASK